jgi:hypothetical protein
MNRRIVQSLKVLALFLLLDGLTWSLSWGMQFLCGKIIPGSEFHLASLEANRLAAVTVLTTLVIMFILQILADVEGCWVPICFGLSTPALLWLGGKALEALPSTAVSVVPAQIVYCIIVVLWSALMWYILLDDEDEKNKKTTKNTPRTDKK